MENIYTLDPRPFKDGSKLAQWHEWPTWLKWDWIKRRRKQHRINF